MLLTYVYQKQLSLLCSNVIEFIYFNIVNTKMFRFTICLAKKGFRCSKCVPNQVHSRPQIKVKLHNQQYFSVRLL